MKIQENTTVKRSTIGKLSDEDPDRMRPNENFRKFFPDVEVPEERADAGRSSALKAGTYMVINKVVKELGLAEKLETAFGIRNSGLILDLAAYSVITENNAAQYYSDYAYNHPLFTPNMRAYSDSTISDCKYRLVSAYCTVIECMLSGVSVHAFRGIVHVQGLSYNEDGTHACDYHL